MGGVDKKDVPSPNSVNTAQTFAPMKDKTDRQTDKYERERERERERESSLFTRVTDKHVCFFYIQPSPKQERQT